MPATGRGAGRRPSRRDDQTCSIGGGERGPDGRKISRQAKAAQARAGRVAKSCPKRMSRRPRRASHFQRPTLQRAPTPPPRPTGKQDGCRQGSDAAKDEPSKGEPARRRTPSPRAKPPRARTANPRDTKPLGRGQSLEVPPASLKPAPRSMPGAYRQGDGGAAAAYCGPTRFPRHARAGRRSGRCPKPLSLPLPNGPRSRRHHAAVCAAISDGVGAAASPGRTTGPADLSIGSLAKRPIPFPRKNLTTLLEYYSRVAI